MAEAEVKVVSTDNFDMHYTVFGNGPKTLVIIPGVSMTPVYLSAEAVRNQYSMFWDDYTVYVFDRIDDMKPGYTTEDMAEDTAQAMISLGISNACVMGVSHGGMMAQYLAEEHPELVKKLALCSTLSRQNPISTETFSNWVRLASEGDVVSLNRDIYNHVYSNWYYQKFAEVFRRLETVGDQNDIMRFGIVARACLDFDRYEYLNKITCPTIVFATWGDSALGYQGSIEIAEALKCTLVIKDHYGHASYDECPDQAIEMKLFLDRQN
ncbi:MAG: alpha/beta hydrolase [Lachnospiraceae bacterium]|nr:alpha/beta hydrolase [Lachnospiraceae bacterium]